MSVNVNIKTDAKAMEYASNAARDLKGAIDGGLESAMSSVKDLVTSTADPAIGMLLGQLNSETSAGRMKLMDSLMDLVDSEGVQAGLTLFNSALNESMKTIALIVTEIAKAQDALGLLDDKLQEARIRIDPTAVHGQTGGMNDNGDITHPPPSGEITPPIGTLTTPSDPVYAWWDPRGWSWLKW